MTVKHGITGVFLDPPYADEAGRTGDLYSQDSGNVAHRVREWAIEMGADSRARIALCVATKANTSCRRIGSASNGRHAADTVPKAITRRGTIPHGNRSGLARTVCGHTCFLI